MCQLGRNSGPVTSGVSIPSQLVLGCLYTVLCRVSLAVSPGLPPNSISSTPRPPVWVLPRGPCPFSLPRSNAICVLQTPRAAGPVLRDNLPISSELLDLLFPRETSRLGISPYPNHSGSSSLH